MEIIFTESDIARFWSKVTKADGCWRWNASHNENGYGVIGFWRHGKANTRKAHRIAYVLTTGDKAEGLDIEHLCHNRGCVNPSHLRAATHKQNMENRPTANTGNISGVRGVHWAKRYTKWEAQVKHNGRSIYLGRYETVAEAEAVVIAKRLELFTNNDADRVAA